MFVLKEILPGTRLAKTLNSVHEATWLVLIWLHPLIIAKATSFRMAAPGWVIYTISVKSRGLAPDPGEPSSASSPRGSPNRVTGKRAREGLGPALPLAPAPVWDPRQWGANGPLPLRCSPREQGRRRRLPFQESRLCHWRSAWAQHLRCPPVATANKLSSGVGTTRSLTPPPGPRRQRPGALRAPHLIRLSPQPGLSQSADPALPAPPWGFPGEGLGLPAEAQEFVGRTGGRCSLPFATSALNFANPTAAALPLPPRRVPGSLGFSNAVPGEGAPQGRREPRARSVLTAITGSLQGRQLLVGHPARLRGPA